MPVPVLHAARFLRLKTAPDRPEERFDFLTQGNIVHEVLAEWWQQPQDVTALFERVFAAHLEEKHIPSGYHTERLRNGDARRSAPLHHGGCAGRARPVSRRPKSSSASRSARAWRSTGRIDRLDTAAGRRKLRDRLQVQRARSA